MSFLRKVNESLTNDFYENEVEFMDTEDIDNELAMEALGANSDDLLQPVDLTDDEMDDLIEEISRELDLIDEEGEIEDEIEPSNSFESALEAMVNSVKILEEDELSVLDDQSIDTGIDMINDLLDDEIEEYGEDNYLGLDDTY